MTPQLVLVETPARRSEIWSHKPAAHQRAQRRNAGHPFRPDANDPRLARAGLTSCYSFTCRWLRRE